MCIATDCIATESAAPGGVINWFAPPTSDIGTALSFYERALETFLSGEVEPASQVDRAGPSSPTPGHGTTAYRAVPDIAAAITRCTQAGGKALTEIIDLPGGMGRIAHMLDADGSRIGLHQPGWLAGLRSPHMSPIADISPPGA